MAYVYLHRTNTDNTVFYVGIGSDDDYKRSHNKLKRSKAWYETVKAGNGFTVEILYDNLTYERALALEIETIAKIGRSSLNEGPLVNLTAGGQGKKGFIHTKETIQKIITSEGYKNRDTSQKNSKNKTYDEIYGKDKADKIREKQSKADRPPTKSGVDHHLYGKKRPEHSAKLKGRSNEKMKGLLVGDKNPMKDLENRKKVSIAKTGIKRPILVCPHCKKEGGTGNMQRWHFDNCAHK